MGKVLLYLVIVGAIVFLAAGCDAALGAQVQPEQAISAMASAGYANVSIVSRDNWLVDLKGCASEDNALFNMAATNPRGEVVTNAYVCVGWPWKGATIRYH